MERIELIKLRFYSKHDVKMAFLHPVPILYINQLSWRTGARVVYVHYLPCDGVGLDGGGGVLPTASGEMRKVKEW